ncbi:MAG: DUF4258 domain-containing protein [Chitinophagia bacterium]|nr:DUF4258 domain-containing protein [Chitinophagia bacterium]
MEFAFSHHALEQMTARGITAATVKELLDDAAQIVEQNEITIYQALLNEYGKTYLIRIFVNTEKQPPLVITVYKTSKIGKYYEGEI